MGTYYDRSYDEIKIKLPLALTGGHHLLFTFLHVSGKAREPEAVIGYSVLPVLSNEVLMVSKENTLPVILDTLPPNYLAPEAEEHMKVCKDHLATRCHSPKSLYSTSIASARSSSAAYHLSLQCTRRCAPRILLTLIDEYWSKFLCTG